MLSGASVLKAGKMRREYKDEKDDFGPAKKNMDNLGKEAGGTQPFEELRVFHLLRTSLQRSVKRLKLITKTRK